MFLINAKARDNEITINDNTFNINKMMMTVHLSRKWMTMVIIMATNETNIVIAPYGLLNVAFYFAVAYL